MQDDSLQESIADEMRSNRRRTAIKTLVAMTDELPTEDIELVIERFPNLVECAFNEILNPNA